MTRWSTLPGRIPFDEMVETQALAEEPVAPVNSELEVERLMRLSLLG